MGSYGAMPRVSTRTAVRSHACVELRLQPLWSAEMFSLASACFAGRSVLVIEQERCAADLITRAVVKEGGAVVAEAASVFLAMASLRQATQVNCVVIDVAEALAFSEPIGPLLSAMGIEVVFVAFDDCPFTED